MSQSNSATVYAFPSPAVEPFVTRRELAGLLGVSVRMVDRMIAEGLPVRRWGRRTVRVRVSEALAWLEGDDVRRSTPKEDE